jgi:hypothetical protein
MLWLICALSLASCLASKLFSVVWSLSAPHCQSVVVDGLITETLVAKKQLLLQFQRQHQHQLHKSRSSPASRFDHASCMHRKSTARPYNSSARTYVWRSGLNCHSYIVGVLDTYCTYHSPVQCSPADRRWIRITQQKPYQHVRQVIGSVP